MSGPNWIPTEYRDPDNLTENITPKVLPYTWGGTGISATDLTSLKSYLGIGDADMARLSPMRRHQTPDSGTVFQDFGMSAAGVISSTALVGIDRVIDGTYLRLTEDGSVPTGCGFVSALEIQRRWAPDVVFVFRPVLRVNGPAYTRLWVGLFSTSPTGLDVPAAGHKVAAMRFNPGLDVYPTEPITGWRTVTNNGTTNTMPTATVSVSPGNGSITAVRIRNLGGGTNWEFMAWDFATSAWVSLSIQAGGPAASDALYAQILQERVAPETDPAHYTKTLGIKCIDIIQE